MLCPYHDTEAETLACDGSCVDDDDAPSWLTDAIENYADDDPSPYAGTYTED
jgi:hypothetical protein